ncbi:hypothetical protein [Paraflavitalea sp. CAU 1676]|uniref:hypothetical protein n=1 Tax=Paraflavitalea sp. CAU 1676 TaxID=3032598 RepID=UPI0023DC5CFB|nr:hypothetical protein [Paraflavitalea sp. CAU 1676]MDF2193266.1 hypothetical protein [Paraflavitalea sp. CAU 1676]
MELHELLSPFVKCLSAISLGGLFLLMLFGDKIKLNGKEKGGRNLGITLGFSLVATLAFSLITIAILYENATLAIGTELMPASAQICGMLALLSFIPVAVATCRIASLVMRRRQDHA